MEFAIIPIVYVIIIVVIAVSVSKKIRQSNGTAKDKTSTKKATAPKKEYKKTSTEVKSVHSGCEHDHDATPNTLAWTYGLRWDDFREYVKKLYAMDHTQITTPTYRYRGSPDFVLKSKGKEVEIHLFQMHDDGVIPDDWFNTAVASCNTQDKVADVFVTNGNFSVSQKVKASQKHIALTNGDSLAVLMSRYARFVPKVEDKEGSSDTAKISVK